VASYKTFSELLIENFNSRIQKNSPTGSVKTCASMVGRMFAVGTMSCSGERFTEVGIESGLLGIVP